MQLAARHPAPESLVRHSSLHKRFLGVDWAASPDALIRTPLAPPPGGHGGGGGDDDDAVGAMDLELLAAVGAEIVAGGLRAIAAEGGAGRMEATAAALARGLQNYMLFIQEYPPDPQDALGMAVPYFTPGRWDKGVMEVADANPFVLELLGVLARASPASLKECSAIWISLLAVRMGQCSKRVSVSAGSGLDPRPPAAALARVFLAAGWLPPPLDGAPECFHLVPSEDVCTLLKLIWDHIMGFMDPAAGLGAVTQATPLPAPAMAGLRKLVHRNLEALAPYFAKLVRAGPPPGKPKGTEKTENRV